MPTFWPFRTESKQDAFASVPIVTDLSRLIYPPDNYENFAKEGYGRNEIVYACIRELATAAAQGTYTVQIPSRDGGINEDLTGPFAALINRPNPLQDWYTFIERIVTYLHVSGNVYVLKQRTVGSRVTELWLLRPDRVNILPKSDGRNDYSYEMDGHSYHLAFEDVVHLKLPNPSDDTFGLSPLHVLARTVNVDAAITSYSKSFFENSGIPSGLLKIKRRLNSQEEASVIRSRWRSSFGGRNMHSVAILDEDAVYEPMAGKPGDMALGDLRKNTETRICAVFGVPPILINAEVGIERSSYNNYREARFAFFSETVAPLVTRIVRFFNFILTEEFPNQGQLTVDMGELRAYLDEDDSVTNRATHLFLSGLVSLNEARQTVGLDAVEDGDVRRIPANVTEAVPGQEVTTTLTAPVMTELKELKALEPLAPRALALRDRLLKEREDLTDTWTPAFEKHFVSLKNRVDGILGRLMERGRGIDETKQFPVGPEELNPAELANELGELIRRMYVGTSKATFDAVNESGLAGTVQWSEQSPIVTGVITSVPERTRMIHSTTTKVIRKALERALSNGYSIEQLARGVPADGFPGLQSILTETKIRARLIARTEIMRSQNMTTTKIYQEQGFQYVRADDVDGGKHDNSVPPGDPYGYTCAQRHNQVYEIGDAYNIMDHPNGTLNWSPMPRSYKPA